MTKADKIRAALERNPRSVSYDEGTAALTVRADLRAAAATGNQPCSVPDAVAGRPRVNIHRGKNGEAKPYQVKQVLAAIKKIEEQS
ncbi:toxin HicA [Rhodococcus sp. NPDC047139]|uniref:toxin HicA n=1 Tax=Rhodococcus sp. NPDC047139 TaxID=3155141 RepID=UPI0033C730C5